MNDICRNHDHHKWKQKTNKHWILKFVITLTMFNSIVSFPFLHQVWFIKNKNAQNMTKIISFTWWRHQMETFSALLAICAGNSPVPGEFPTQRPVTRSFDVYFDLRPNKWLSKQSWGWWFETLSCSLWRHRNDEWVACLMMAMATEVLFGKAFLLSNLQFCVDPCMFVLNHDDVTKWKHFPRYWPFVRGIHRSPVNSPHKGQWRGALMLSLICARING